MGIVLCDIHGHGAIVEACEHIAEQIDRGLSPTGHRFALLADLFICHDCFDALGFERFRSFFDLPVDEFLDIDDGSIAPLEKAYEGIKGRRVFCSKCIAEIERRKSSL
jgi:hypothetical protein